MYNCSNEWLTSVRRREKFSLMSALNISVNVGVLSSSSSSLPPALVVPVSQSQSLELSV